MGITRADLLDHLREIEVQKPSDLIIKQIKTFISEGILKPGDRLPSERALVEKFGVGRGHVREAIKKLEFYGVLKTVPQNGTYVSSIGVKAIEGLIDNLLKLHKEDFESLIETRGLLEVYAAKLTALRAEDREIRKIEEAHDDFKKQVLMGNSGIEEDLVFHLRIAEYCKNSILQSLITLITPNVITFTKELNTCKDGRFKIALQEHERILKAIKEKNPAQAESAMREHLKQTLAIAKH